MSEAPLVLAVDDEQAILDVLQAELEHHAMRFVGVSDSAAAIAQVERHQPDVIVLDILMPPPDGLEVLRDLRRGSQVPVLVLTARAGEEDVVRALDLGADDFLAKPFSLAVLRARLRALIRRRDREPAGRGADSAGSTPLAVWEEFGRALVRLGEKTVALGQHEQTLMRVLAERPGVTVTQGELIRSLWGEETQVDIQYLRVWINRLRGKLEPEPHRPRWIRTVQSVGYRWAGPTPQYLERPPEQGGRESG